jgi:hypothetical protein
MKILISISLNGDESAACADKLDETLVTVRDGKGALYPLCAARGLVLLDLDDQPISILPRDYTEAPPKKKKGIFGR